MSHLHSFQDFPPVSDRDREAITKGQVVCYALTEHNGFIQISRTTALKEQFLDPSIKQHMGEIILDEFQQSLKHLTKETTA